MNAVEVWVAGGRGWLVDLTENRPICLREFPAVVGWLGTATSSTPHFSNDVNGQSEPYCRFY